MGEIKVFETEQGFYAVRFDNALGNNPQTGMWPTRREAYAAAERGEFDG